jgi:plastocyanin
MAGAALWFAVAGMSFAASNAAWAADAAKPADPAQSAHPAHQIVVQNFMFSPVSMKVKAGTQVTWTNKDEEPHTVSSNDGVFRSFALDTNDSFSFKFDKPGTYKYTCTIHPRMTGTIVVE